MFSTGTRMDDIHDLKRAVETATTLVRRSVAHQKTRMDFIRSWLCLACACMPCTHSYAFSVYIYLQIAILWDLSCCNSTFFAHSPPLARLTRLLGFLVSIASLNLFFNVEFCIFCQNVVLFVCELHSACSSRVMRRFLHLPVQPRCCPTLPLAPHCMPSLSRTGSLCQQPQRAPSLTSPSASSSSAQATAAGTVSSHYAVPFPIIHS